MKMQLLRAPLAFAVLSAVTDLGNASTTATATATPTNATRPKAILDNDWDSTGFIDFLVVLNAGWDILGLTSNTANSWALQNGLHALANLEIGNLSCIPVYRGGDYPILNHPGLFQAWEAVHGKLPWEGAFAPENLTNEALGFDPTSGNPDRIVRAAFVEGYPNTTFASSLSAAEFMVQQVRKYPGEISIYAAGALTNVALAARMDSSFARNCKQLVVMGGYIDDNLLQVTGSVLQADINSDINLLIDPEASKIALTAEFPSITLLGNAANQVMRSRDVWDGIDNRYTRVLNAAYDLDFPFWDETAAAVMVHPDLVMNSTSFYVDVDTSYGSPSYGNIHAYQKALAPRAQKLREVKYPSRINGTALKERLRDSLRNPPTCKSL